MLRIGAINIVKESETGKLLHETYGVWIYIFKIYCLFLNAHLLMRLFITVFYTVVTRQLCYIFIKLISSLLSFISKSSCDCYRDYTLTTNTIITFVKYLIYTGY